MTLTSLEKWEHRLKEALDSVDECLEERYGHLLARNPRRPAHGTTANRKYDGIFSIDSKFSLGLITGDGPSYVIDIRIFPITPLSPEMTETIYGDIAALLPQAIKEMFPEQELSIERQGQQFRITGDLDFTQTDNNPEA